MPLRHERSTEVRVTGNKDTQKDAPIGLKAAQRSFFFFFVPVQIAHSHTVRM